MIFAGFGFRRSATMASLRAALEQAWDGDGVLAGLATLEDKIEPAAELARLLSLPLIPIAPQWRAALPLLSHSTAAHTARGTGSVAEACALTAAGGASARLIAPRVISSDRLASCAIAEGVST